MTVSAAAAGPRPTGDRYHDQQCHAHADCDRGGGTAHRETAVGRPAHGAANRNGFSMKRTVSTASPRRARPLPVPPSGWPDDAGAHQQQRPVPQIPRVRYPADRAHRPHCQDTPASLRRGGTARADHQRRPQHGQQRGGTGIGRGLAQPGAGQQNHPQPCPPRDRGGQWRESAPLAGREGHQAADRQLPGPGGQRKERHGRHHASE